MGLIVWMIVIIVILAIIGSDVKKGADEIGLHL